MHPDLPTYLYKYFEPERVGVLSDFLVRFSPLASFNDPFEGVSKITGLEAAGDVETDIGSMPMDDINAMYESLPQTLKNSITFNEVLYMVTYFKKAELEKVDEQLKGRVSLVDAFVTRNIDKMLGALCLSEVPDSLLMWAHYARSHTGFVLELDSSHPYFDQRRADDDEICFVRRIRYRESIPEGPLGLLGAVELALTKSTQWLYEREWRLLMPLTNADKVVASDAEPVHLFALPAEAMSAVILGARASRGTSDSVTKAISENPKLKHVQLKYSTPDAYNYSLRMVRNEQAQKITGNEL